MRLPAFKRFLFLALICLLTNAVKAQKYEQAFITDENINEIIDWRKLGSVQKLPHNKNYLRKMVKKLDHYERYDSLFLVKLVDSIASLKMSESFHFLTDLCCRYIDYTPKNDLTRMAWVVNRYGGRRALNKYYLHDSIHYINDPVAFHAMVYYAMREKFPVDMSYSYYLRPKQKIPPPPPLPKVVLKQAKLHPDCDSIFRINDVNINELDNPYQFLFINRTPRNKLDSLVQDLLAAGARDSLLITGIIDRIGQIQSQESFCFLYNTICRPIFIHDLNPFNSLNGIMTYYSGYRTLNKYYLDNAISDSLNYYDFAREVILLIRNKEPECYYCRPMNWQQLTVREMGKIDTRKTEKEIRNIIHKNSDLSKVGGYEKYNFALDSILKQVLRLPGISDAYFDYCEIKITIYPGHMTLGVIIETPGMPVQESFMIQVGEIPSYYLFGKRVPFIRKKNTDHLVHKKEWRRYEPEFIRKQRALCEGMNYER